MSEMEIDTSVVKIEVKQNKDETFMCDDCFTGSNSDDLLAKHSSTCAERKPRVCHFPVVGEKELTDPELAAQQDEMKTDLKDAANFVLEKPSGGENEEVTYKNDLGGSALEEGIRNNDNKDLSEETEKKPHVCEQCFVAFANLQTFASHIESHTIGRGSLCPVCNAVFQSEHDLNRHVSLHALNDDTSDVKTSDFTLIHSKPESSEEKPESSEEKSESSEEKPDSSEETFSSAAPLNVVLPRVGEDVLLGDTTNKSKPHHCEMCGKSFISKSGLSKHRRKHCSNDTLQMCTECGESFKTKLQLDRHVIKIHKTEKVLNNNTQDVPGVPEIEDTTSQNRCKSRSGLMQHQVQHKMDKSFFCHHCGKGFKRKSHLQRHEMTHDKREKHEKPYTCEKCDKHFTEKEGLRRHEFVHRDEKPHKCEKCEESFTRKDSLVQHMVRKHDQLPHIPDVNRYVIENGCATIHQCDECDKSFPYKPFLTQHKLQQHIGKDLIGNNTFLCDVCPKSFFSKASLTKHMLIHNAEKSHQCDQCHKLFLRKYQLKDHMRTHTGEKPHICDQCGKAFGFISDMKKHQVSVHTDVKQHKCEHCERRFSHRTQLNKHMAKHSTGKTCQCDLCEKLFPHEYLMKKHKMTHVKPYQCSFCDKSFYSKNHLKQHLPMHTGEKAFRCNMCGKSFGHNASLSNHRRKSCPKRPLQNSVEGEEIASGE